MASRRLSWQIPRIAVAITVNLRLRRIAVDSRGNCRRLTWQLPLIAIEIAVATCRCLPWKLPWQLPRKLPWQSSRNVVVCRGNCRRLPFVKIAVDCRKLPFVKCGNRRGNSHGWPRDVVVFRGNCNILASVEIAVAIALDYRGNCRVLPCHLPWQLPWNAVPFAVDCRGLPRQLTWGWPWNMPWQLPWYFSGLPWRVPWRLPRTEQRHVTWPNRGTCCGNPRISTVARGKTHGRSRTCHGH